MLNISVRKSLVFAVPVVAAFALSAVYARAGYRYSPSTVGVTPSAGYGSMGSARNSSDTRQYIGCSVDTYATGTAASVYCSATDASGRTAACASYNPVLVAAANSLSGDSYVAFYFDGSGTCTELYTTTASSFAPKNP
jgi:hypothetical protein